MLLLGRSRRGNPIYISLPSPALEASRPIVHFLGFRASPKIPTSDVCLRQAPKCNFKIIGFNFEMAGFSFKMISFRFKMVGFSFKMAGFNFKMIGFSFKMANFGFKMAHSRPQMANLSFQRGPGQDLAENGPFAFKPHKEFIQKKYGFHFGNFGLPNRPNDHFGVKTVTFSFKLANFGFTFSLKMANFGFKMAHSRPPNDHFGFKTVTFTFKMANFGFKMVHSRLKMANLGFQRGPGQDLADLGFRV